MFVTNNSFQIYMMYMFTLALLEVRVVFLYKNVLNFVLFIFFPLFFSSLLKATTRWEFFLILHSFFISRYDFLSDFGVRRPVAAGTER